MARVIWFLIAVIYTFAPIIYAQPVAESSTAPDAATYYNQGRAALVNSRFDEARIHFTDAQRLHKQLGNVLGEADALNGLGEVERTLGRNDEAYGYFTDAQRLHKRIGNVAGEANALIGLGDVERVLGRTEEARIHFIDAQRMHRKIGNVMGVANALVGLGTVESTLGRNDEAREHFSDALRLHKQIGNVLGEANALLGFGDVERALGRNDDARKHFANAQRLHKQIGNVRGEANALDGLGDVDRALGRNDEARTHFTDAKNLHKQIGNVRGEANALDGLGNVERVLGRNDIAYRHFTDALRLHKQIDNVVGEANALMGLGEVDRTLGRYVEAGKHFTDARRLYKQSDSLLGEANALFGLAEINRAQKNEDEARKLYRDAAILYGVAAQPTQQTQANKLATEAWPAPEQPSSGLNQLEWWKAAIIVIVALILAGIFGRKFILARDQPRMPPNASAAAWQTMTVPNSDTAIVFVHGIFSGPGGAWGKWPEIIAADARIKQALGTAPDIFLAGYHTALDSGEYKIEHAADSLRVQLRTANVQEQAPALSRKRIIFIAHSTGGIVARDVLERYRDDFAGKTVGLVLMASPSRGSAWADRLIMLARLANNKMAQQLSPKNDYLTNLDRRFADFVQRPPYALKGLDVFEQKFVIPNRFFATLFSVERVVNPDAQSSYFGSPKIAADTDHFTIIKPVDASHPSHQYFVDFLTHTFVVGNDKR